MDKMKKVPEMRFKEFEEEWVQSKLGDCFLERVERSAIGELISVTINNGVVKAADTGRADSSSADKSNYKRVEVGDIAYNSMRMWQGACGYSSYSGILSPAYTVVTPTNGVDVKFYYYLFKRTDSLYQFRINSQGLTSDTWNLKYPSFSKINCMVPKEPEQKRIAELFLHIDNLVSKLEQKLEKLRNIKQSLLNQMFVNVNRGGYAPLIRFKGYADKWIMVLLKDVSRKVTEKNSSFDYKDVFTNSAELGIINQHDYFDHDVANVESIQGYYKVAPNDYVYNPRISTSAPVGPINRNKLAYGGVMSPLYYVFRVDDKDFGSLDFLDFFFKSDVWHEFMFKNGNSGARSDRFSISDDVFVEMPIAHPKSKREQKTIGNFLASMDTALQNETYKLTKLRTMKQSLLQKMFV